MIVVASFGYSKILLIILIGFSPLLFCLRFFYENFSLYIFNEYVMYMVRRKESCDG